MNPPTAPMSDSPAPLPDRYWRQQSHLVAPADGDRAAKALTRGTDPAGRLLGGAGIDGEALADRLGLDPVLVERAIVEPVPAPVVVLDGEDGVAPTAEARLAAARAAGSALRDTPGTVAQLRFFRPVAARDPQAADIVAAFFEELGSGACDGLILPKVESPDDVFFFARLLDAYEATLPRQAGRLRIGVMVESARGQLALGEILGARPDRLCCVVIGTVDYAADLGLLGSSDDHPQIAALRQWVVAHAARARVPAIDGMTLEFPVAGRTWPADRRRDFVLDRMALVFRQTRAAIDNGLRGKWVGHPLQLLAVLLAFADTYSPRRIQQALDDSGLYADAAAAGRGVDIIGTAMSDAATDARVRRYLIDARRLGYLQDGSGEATSAACS